MCLGAAGPVEASMPRGTSAAQAEQRETFESLLGAIQQAAKKLTDQLTGQAALHESHRSVQTPITCIQPIHAASAQTPAVQFLREALLNLPPPAY
jgi:hypothetical protein